MRTDASIAAAHQAHRAGDTAEAERRYRAILAVDRDADAAWHGLGAIAHANGRHAEAIALIGRALRAAPRTGHYHIVLGLALLAEGETEAARASLSLAATLEPSDWRAHAAHGRVLARLGRNEAAAEALARAVALAPPDEAEPRHALATLALAAGRADDAIDGFAAVAALRPDDPAALGNLGASLQAAGRFAAADAVLTVALERAPDAVAAWNNRGLARLGLGRLDDALADLREAAGRAPDDASVRRNLAAAHAERGEDDAARALLDRVLAANPDDRDALLNRGTLDLAAGRLASGWRGYAMRPGPPASWDGRPLDPPGRLLVEAEQGLGDTLMFLRFVAPAAVRAGAPVLLRVPAPLRRLAAALPGIGAVLDPGDPTPPAVAARVRVGDLAAPFAPTLDAIPAPAPFHVDPAAQASWRARLDAARPPVVAGGKRLAVGVAGAGNPRYRQDRRRSIPPERLAPLGAVAGVTLVALGDGTPPDGAWSPDPAPHDFAELAALLAALDAVVTVDTAIVHLAGSLGVPTLLLDRVGGDWRWLRDRPVSPWYPAVTILRDDAPHSPSRAWFGPVAAAAALLDGWIRAGHGRS